MKWAEQYRLQDKGKECLVENRTCGPCAIREAREDGTHKMYCQNGCGRLRARYYVTCCRTCTGMAGEHGPACEALQKKIDTCIKQQIKWAEQYRLQDKGKECSWCEGGCEEGKNRWEERRREVDSTASNESKTQTTHKCSICSRAIFAHDEGFHESIHSDCRLEVNNRRWAATIQIIQDIRSRCAREDADKSKKSVKDCSETEIDESSDDIPLRPVHHVKFRKAKDKRRGKSGTIKAKEGRAASSVTTSSARA